MHRGVLILGEEVEASVWGDKFILPKQNSVTAAISVHTGDPERDNKMATPYKTL